MKTIALAVTILSIAAGAMAQAPSATSPDVMPKHNCVRPDIPDMSKKVTENQMAAFVAALNKYKECAEGFAQIQQKEAERVQKAAQVTAQSLVAAGNVAIKDYNDFVEEAGKAMATKPAPPKPQAESSREGNVDTVPSRIPRKN